MIALPFRRNDRIRLIDRLQAFFLHSREKSNRCAGGNFKSNRKKSPFLCCASFNFSKVPTLCIFLF